jgi:hypothetical protein
VGLDSVLARDRRRNPGRDFLTCEVLEGAAFLFDSAVRVAFLGGVCGAHLASVIHRQFALNALDGGEAVIENCIPQDIAGWQPDRRNEVVPE